MKNRPNDRGGSRASSDSSSSGGRIDAGATLEYLSKSRKYRQNMQMYNYTRHLSKHKTFV